MTRFTLTMQGRRAARDLVYDTAASTLRWADNGAPVDLSPVGMGYAPRAHMAATVVSPEQPGRKTRRLRALKIQMGLKCNYACSYCNQASQPQEEQGDLSAFLSGLDAWVDGEPQRVEFWGGEPFAYWKTLKPLSETLRAKWPRATFSVITNGSLLDAEKVEWAKRVKASICISHDGPGHKAARGPDPFDDPKQAEALRAAYRELSPTRRIAFNCVLTRDNRSLDAIRNWISRRLDIHPDDLVLNTEELLLPYDVGGLALSPMTPEEHAAVHDQLFDEIAGGNSARSVVQVRAKIDDFFRSIAEARPVMANGQKCGMDRPDALAVDLKGNAVTCQNTSAATKHLMGNVASFDDIRLTQARHFSTRPECLSCPVVQLCQGACMFLDGALFEAACANSYTYNTAVLKAALYFLTGALLVQLKEEAA